MRRAGVFLIFLAVALRTIPKYTDNDTFGIILGGLIAYGVLLFIEEWQAPRFENSSPKSFRFLMAAYLLIQLALTILLLATEPYEDYASLLVLPLALQVVFTFGWKIGRIWIAFNGLVLLITLFQVDGSLGVVMSVFYTGFSLLLGAYANHIQKANRIRDENRRMFVDLRNAHENLKGYAGQREELAAEQERTRLARELHDSVTQTVFSMNLAVQSTRMMLEKDPTRAAGQLDRLQELSRGALAQIQQLVAQLQQTPQQGEDLPSALRELVRQKQQQDGLVIDLAVMGSRDVSQKVRENLLRIISEALTNIIKHAGTKEVRIALNLEASPAFLEIEDSGAGFNDQEQAKKGHLGLVSMKERAGEIGWTLTIRSKSGEGTLLRIEEMAEALE